MTVLQAGDQTTAPRGQRWLNESVPALGGVTPRQAADDPTRRDDLVRLIDGFPEPEPGSEFFSFRPDRLRKLLGLPRRRLLR